MRHPAVTGVPLVMRTAGAAVATMFEKTKRTVSSIPSVPLAMPASRSPLATSAEGLSSSSHVMTRVLAPSGPVRACSRVRSSSNLGVTMKASPRAGMMTAVMRSDSHHSMPVK